MEQLSLSSSGLSAFRRCRRKWDLQYRQQWKPKHKGKNLLFGSAFHAAIELIHKTNPPNFTVSRRTNPVLYELLTKVLAPLDNLDVMTPLLDLLYSMLEYYVIWLHQYNRDPLETMFIDGRPLCEQPIALNVAGHTFKAVLDRVVIYNNMLWVVEYKTVTDFNTAKLIKDAQATAYIWALEKVLGHWLPVGGCVYQQHRKAIPKTPKVLKSGALTTDRSKLKNCPEHIYRQEIDRLHHNPNDYVEILDWLHDQSDIDHDHFVRRTWVARTPTELQSFEESLLDQIPEYTDPALTIYPNPTSDCTWDCDYATVCDAINSKGDPQSILDALFTKEEKVSNDLKEIPLDGEQTNAHE